MTRLERTCSAYLAKVDRDLCNHLTRGLEFIDWKEQIRKDSTVFIKPNFTFPQHREGVTTSPELLRELLGVLRRRTSKIIVGESDGGDRSFQAEEAFRGHGLYDICEEAGAELVNLSHLPSKFVEAEIQSKKVKVEVPKMLLEKVDCFISVPVLKVHVITGVSLGIKNLWGCCPNTMRGLHHQNLDRKLVLLAKILNPKIVIIDGSYGLDGHGPMFGNPVRMDLLTVANNAVLADTLGALIMGFDIERIRHLMIAQKEGLGSSNLLDSRVNVDWRQYQRHFQIRKTLLDRFSSLLFYSDALAKIVMDSPLTPLIYGIASNLRTPEEKELALQSNATKV